MLSIFMCGYNDEKDNIKCNIEQEKEIFNLLNEYDVYADVINFQSLPQFRRKLIVLLNKKISNDIKNNLNKMLEIINTAQLKEKGIYWY